MTFYWWNHWFWITWFSTFLLLQQQHQSVIYAMPMSFSSFETISTSLKSALVQNDNSFQQTNEQQKIATGSKSVPLTFETSDTDDLHGGASEIDVEKISKTNEWLAKPSTKNESSSTADNKPKFVSVKLEKNVNSPIPEDIIKSFTLSNVNSTNENASSQISTTMPTTVLSSVTASNAILR